MVARQSTYKVGSESVQGEGSYVIFHQMSFGTIMEAMEKRSGTTKPAEEKAFAEKLLKEAVVEWNWVDDKGAPLLIPSKGLKIEDLLTNEVMWLVDQVTGKAESKNSSSGSPSTSGPK